MVENPVEILLVEDNPSDVELTLLALGEAHVANHIEVVRDGAQALDFVFGQGKFSHRDPHDKPKVILLDLKLPKVDGLEVLRRIKSDPSTKTIPVVVLTSSTQDSDLRECYRLGVNSYVSKPVEFGEFTEAVSKLGLYWLLLNRPPND